MSRVEDRSLGVSKDLITEDSWLRITRGRPWRIDATRRKRWSAESFIRTHASSVRQLGDPILWAKAQKARLPTDVAEEMAAELFASMVLARGVGIAAPQIGIPLRVAILDHGQAGIVVLNPVVKRISNEIALIDEACLSVPDMAGYVDRPITATLKAVDIKGRSFEVTGRGRGAQLILHETDHLDGLLYINRATPANLYVRRYHRHGQLRDEPEDVPGGGPSPRRE